MRLIDAEALKEKLDELEPYIDCDENSTTWILSDEVYNAVDNSQTVELNESVIQEVLNKRCMTVVANEYLIALHGKRPQGEWIMHIDETFPNESTQECNVCHAEQTICGNDDNYCPNCGAEMRGAE